MGSFYTSQALNIQVAAALCTALLVLWTLMRKTNTPKAIPLPPGPKPLPVIGNILDVPTKKPWEVYQSWSHTYGDLIFLTLPGQPLLIVGSTKVAIDLFEKRSQIYSDRRLPLMLDLLSWGWNFAFMRYGQNWRDHRRAFHQYFHQSVVEEYFPVQIQETRAFLRRVLTSQESPADHEHNVRHIFSAAILKIVYGTEISGVYDEYITVVKKAVEGLSLAVWPGAFWVEFFPFLQHLPAWVPGTRFKQFANEYRPFVEQSRDEPFDLVKKAANEGTATPSVALSLIQAMDTGAKLDPRREEVARNVTGLAYTAAADTTTSAGLSFLVAMAKYPKIRKKAQAELDAHLGERRLPDFSDFESLNYVRAVVLETLRWMPVVPLGVAHCASTDDVYNGFLIPKGTLILPNAWGMLHNPEEFPDPEEFRPERFLKADGTLDHTVLDPATVAFGFGRRICPGRYLAQNSLFMMVASTLFALNIEPALDEKGMPVDLNPEMTFGLASFPSSVDCVLKPRSEAITRLVLGGDVEC